MSDATLPGVRAALVDPGGTTSRPFYTFFQSQATNLSALSERVSAIEAAPSGSGNLSPNANVVGSYSISVQGALRTGIVRVLLEGDVEFAGATNYYGSDSTGAKGWHAVSDALADSTNIVKSVDAGGVTSFDLTDVTVGSSGTLQKYGFDAKGRLNNQSSATTSDLSEGSNLYFTDERAQDAIGAALDGTGNVPLTYDDAGNKISAALSSGVLASLTLADSAVQSVVAGTGVSVDNTDPQNPVISTTGSGSGDVVGPASAADGDIALFDGITGKLIKSGGALATAVQSVALTGLSLATSAVIAATDTVLLAFGKLQAQITDNLLPPGYIDGLKMVWVSGTALTVTSGAAYIPSLSKVLRATADIAKTGLSLSASTWYHVYLYSNAGTPDIEISTTAPAAAYSGTARNKTGDTSRRYAGSFVTDAAGSVVGALASGNKFAILKDCTLSPFRVLANGMATSSTAVSVAGAAPVTATMVTIVVQSLDATKAAVIGSSLGSPQIYTINPGGRYALDFPVDAAQKMQYQMAAGAAAGLYIDVIGYVIER